MRVMEQIKKLEAKKRKNQVIVIVWDTGGCNDQSDFEHVTYVGEHRSTDEFDDESDTLYGLKVKDTDGYNKVIDEGDFDEIKRIMLVKKDWAKKVQAMDTDCKRPKNTVRHVGIELEFLSKLSRPEVAMLMVDAGVEDFVTVKEDGSLESEDSGYDFTHEITILASEREFPRVVNRICKVLKGNSTVNKSCGMHVHLDMRTRNPDAAYSALYQAQPVLYAMCPKSRRTGTYSKPVTHFTAFTEDAARMYHDGDRYYGINKSSYMKHGTIEVRIHSGTLLADKICNWVNLLIKIVDNPSYGSDRPELCREVKHLKSRAKVRGKLAKYIDGRIQAFKDEHGRSEIALVG